MTEDQLRAEFSRLEESLKHASKVNAAAAAKKVIEEAKRAAIEVNQELEKHIAKVDQLAVEGKAERLSIKATMTVMNEKMDRFSASLIGLQNAKLFQQGITSFALALAIVVGWKALGG